MLATLVRHQVSSQPLAVAGIGACVQCCISSSAIQKSLEEIEELLASAGDLASEVELAVEKLPNVVEALSSDKQSLIDEVERLKQQLQEKKRLLARICG